MWVEGKGWEGDGGHRPSKADMEAAERESQEKQDLREFGQKITYVHMDVPRRICQD